MQKPQRFCLNVYRGGVARAANCHVFGAIGLWYEMPFDQFEEVLKSMGFQSAKIFMIPNFDAHTSDDDAIDQISDFVDVLNEKVGMLATWVWPETAKEKCND